MLLYRHGLTPQQACHSQKKMKTGLNFQTVSHFQTNAFLSETSKQLHQIGAAWREAMNPPGDQI